MACDGWIAELRYMYVFILLTSFCLLLINIGNTSIFVMWASRFCCQRYKSDFKLVCACDSIPSNGGLIFTVKLSNSCMHSVFFIQGANSQVKLFALLVTLHTS